MKRIIILNSWLWGSWLVLCFLVLMLQDPENRQPGVYALIAALWSFPLAALGVIWWPICKQIQWQRTPPVGFFAIHLVLANIFTLLWLTLAFGGIRLFFSGVPLGKIDIYSVAIWLYPTGVLSYVILSGMYYWRMDRQRLVQSSAVKSPPPDSQWKTLKNLINPQFIFETLEQINQIINTRPTHARKMLKSITEILRHMLTHKSSEIVSLEEELNFAHHYLELEKIRLEDRLQYEENVDPELYTHPVPVMVLQPLLENAIENSIARGQGGGWVRLNINRGENAIVGIVENSLQKISPREEMESIQKESAGLKDLQQRLALIYGKDVQFSAQTVPEEKLFRVKFYLPSKTSE